MSTDRKLIQQELDALIELGKELNRRLDDIDEALRARLAQPEPEPYCHIYEYDSVYGIHREFSPHEWNGMRPTRTVPLYTTPPQRKWQWLTNDESAELTYASVLEIEQAIKEKNT